MEITKRLLIISIVLVLIHSCDCIQHVQGYIVDSSNLQPIDSAEISRYYHKPRLYPYEQKNYTDSTGRFDYKTKTGGLFRCPKLQFYIVKPGFEIYKKRYQSCCTDNDTIKLIRIE